jgi:hypothetical protein
LTAAERRSRVVASSSLPGGARVQCGAHLFQRAAARDDLIEVGRGVGHLVLWGARERGEKKNKGCF